MRVNQEKKRTPKKPRSRPPEPRTGGVQDKDQMNLTDEDSRIMRVTGEGFDQSCNAQAVVATGSMLIVTTEVTQVASGKGQLSPLIERLRGQPKELGGAKRILADSGYLSQSNIKGYAAAKIEPLIAMGRTGHHVSWKRRSTAARKSPPDSATPLHKMTHRLKPPRGMKLFALHKKTRESVFGIIKSVMGYRQWLLRALGSVKGELTFMRMSWNVRRTFALQLG